ncbi:MAG: ribonuclease R [Clostridiaceae bacterium]|nr:ribonuclease R [Clostridiaceae bacterium]
MDILAFMERKDYNPMLLKELAFVLGVPREEQHVLKALLGELEAGGKVVKSKKNRYGMPEHFNLVQGRLQMNEKGFGFVVTDDPGTEDLYIPPGSLNGAMHNDRVLARVLLRGAFNKKDEGEIAKIIERANKTIVGTLFSSKHFLYVKPDERRITENVLIPGKYAGGALPGQKVVIEVTKWPEASKHTEGRVIEILGDKDDPSIDVLYIIKAFNLPSGFPEDVMNEAAEIQQSVPEEALKGRRDLRDLRILTIDGEDARDLDDAVSIEKTPEGFYRLGVHIADVSYYVREGTRLDKEAIKRGTSVYFPDRVIPMLPPQLSNGICSLNPNEDRLTFTVLMDIDSNGEVINHEIFESVVNTVERMTYTSVYKILEEKDEELRRRYSHIVDDLELMKELAILLGAKRATRGAIDFELGEARIILDDEGRIKDIIKFKPTIAEKIIEEFMIVCNETVAENFFWQDAPFVYRIHEDPDREKLVAFSKFVRLLGYRVKGSGDIHPNALQELLEKVKGKKEERLVSTMMLRSLQKAKYSEKNAGHFGLASRYYCHFTAPIRRYPDLIIHRIMKEIINGEMTGARRSHYEKILPGIAVQCSERERMAEEAEQAVEDLKKVEYMQSYLGEVFEGIITSITNFGMIVELDNTVEGIVKLSDMDDDYYILDDMGYFLMGEWTGKQYKIGDLVKVRVVKASKETRLVEFMLEAKVAGKKKTKNKNKNTGEKKKDKKKKKQGDVENG